MPQTPVAPGTSPRLALNPYMSQLQQQFGSFDPNKVQTRRRIYYSFVAYPRAGATAFSFFSQTIGTTNRQLTNIQRSGHLDNPLIVKAIRTNYYITAQNINSFQGMDSNILYADIVNGLFTVGVMRVIIGSKEWIQLPCPFMYAPEATGLAKCLFAGQAATNISRAPFADMNWQRQATYVVDPPFMIGSDQNFQITIEYPSGAVPIIATDLVTSDTAGLFIGVKLDGIEVRPVQ